MEATEIAPFPAYRYSAFGIGAMWQVGGYLVMPTLAS